MASVRILHLSDTHFGAHDDGKRNAVVDFARTYKPDIVAVTGDLRDSPLTRAEASDCALSFLSALRAVCSNVYCVPGNHDSYMGGRLLNRFWRKVQQQISFVEHLTVNGVGVCVQGNRFSFGTMPLLP